MCFHLRARQIYSERIILNIANEQNWDVHTIDVKTAYLSSEIKREVDVRQPPEFEEMNNSGRTYTWRLKHVTYGLSDSGKLWHETFNEIFHILS